MTPVRILALILLAGIATLAVLTWQYLQPYMGEDWFSSRYYFIFFPTAILLVIAIWLWRRS